MVETSADVGSKSFQAPGYHRLSLAVYIIRSGSRIEFALRASVGLVLAYFLVRFYLKKSDAAFTLVLAGFVVGLAYLAEWLRRGRN